MRGSLLRVSRTLLFNNYHITLIEYVRYSSTYVNIHYTSDNHVQRCISSCETSRGYFFSVRLLSVLRGHSVFFSTPPQRPMNYWHHFYNVFGMRGPCSLIGLKLHYSWIIIMVVCLQKVSTKCAYQIECDFLIVYLLVYHM